MEKGMIVKVIVGLSLVMAAISSPVIDVAKSLEAFEPIIETVVPEAQNISDAILSQTVENKKQLKEENIDWSYCPDTDGSLITVNSIKALDPLRIKREVTFEIKGQIMQVDVITKIHIKATMDGYTIKDETQQVGIQLAPTAMTNQVPIDFTDAIPGNYIVIFDNTTVNNRRSCIKMKFTLRK